MSAAIAQRDGRRARPNPAALLQRELRTPEGVPIRVTVARAGDRAVAFLADFALLLLARVALWLTILLAAMALAAAMGGIGANALGPFVALALLADFALRHFWFAAFELRWQGRTPGKRWLGLRVVDRRGGAVTVEAVVARNLLRELETWVPLTALVAPDALWPGAPGWARLLATVWILGFALFPLFNRDRARVGDLVAGTIVIREPRPALLRDLAEQRKGDAGRADEPGYAFTPDELSVYGIYELQALEQLLRAGLVDRSALGLAATKIRKRIGWRGPREIDPERFLEDFYVAQRAHLERKLTLGQRKERREREA